MKFYYIPIISIVLCPLLFIATMLAINIVASVNKNNEETRKYKALLIENSLARWEVIDVDGNTKFIINSEETTETLTSEKK